MGNLSLKRKAGIFTEPLPLLLNLPMPRPSQSSNSVVFIRGSQSKLLLFMSHNTEQGLVQKNVTVCCNMSVS